MNSDAPSSPLPSDGEKGAAKPLGILGGIFAFTAWACFAVVCTNIKTDDAYIFYTYARNLAQGNGYVFNPGEHVNGTTSALYTLVVAALYAVLGSLPGVTLPAIGYAVGMISALAVVLLLMRLLRRDGLVWASLMVPAALFSNLTIFAGVGMETFLTLALILAALDAYLRDRLNRAAFLAALAVLARPDAVLLVFVLGVDFLVSRRHFPPLLPILIFALTLAPWFCFSRLYFGAFLPETFGAKLAQSESGRWGSGYLFLKGAMRNLSRAYGPWSWWLLGISFAAADIVAARRRRSAFLLLSAWGLLYFVAYSVVLNPPAYNWYFVPLALITALWLAACAEVAMLVVPRRVQLPAVIALLALASLRILSVMHDQRVLPVTEKYRQYTEAAAWLNSTQPEGTSIAANEIGILGYFYERGRVIDALGLITKGGAEHVRERDYAWYIREFQPECLVFNHPPRPLLETFAEEGWFKRDYHLATIVRNRVGIYCR